MQPNTNPETGIRYGIINANSLDPEVIDQIQTVGRDINWENALLEVEAQARQGAANQLADGHISVAEVDDVFDTLRDEGEEALRNSLFDCDEPIHEFEIDGVKGRTTWLGGALLVWIFSSPTLNLVDLCSPCVPNCGNLDSPNPLGFKCYDVPSDWKSQ